MNKLIIFCLRRKFGLKRNQQFRFTNQRSIHDTYYFTASRLMKKAGTSNIVMPSNVRLNWLLDDKCKIEKL